jgi:hypothetical protein
MTTHPSWRAHIHGPVRPLSDNTNLKLKVALAGFAVVAAFIVGSTVL